MNVVTFPSSRNPSETTLTRLQLLVLNFLRSHRAANAGAWPSSEEIRVGCGIGPRLGVALVLSNLARRGAISQADAAIRSGE